MADLYKETIAKDVDYVEEDDRVKAIKEMENPDELDAAEDLLSEEIDKLSGKTPEVFSDDEEKAELPEQPEKVEEETLEGKTKDELVNVAAKSISDTMSYLKGNEKAIAILKEQFNGKTEEELVKIITDSRPVKDVIKKEEPILPKIILPEIPIDSPEIQKELGKQTLKRLKAIYPDMPEVEDMESEAYKEWRRDLNIDNPDNSFKDDLAKTRTAVESESSKIIYIQNELSNMYADSPMEVLPFLSEENLPRLKALNDKPMEVLAEDVGKEIEAIRAGLKQSFGLTEKDLGLDFTITKDDKGQPFNKVLNELITEGTAADGSLIPSSQIIGQRGKTFWLKPGELTKKFKEVYNDKILTEYVAKKTNTDRVRKEKLKQETLVEGSGRKSGGGRSVVTLEELSKIEDPAKLDKIIADME